jgi:hypothetical protein
MDTTAEIVLGHAWIRQASEQRSRFTDEDTDVRVAGGFQLIDDLLKATYKPTKEILERNKGFFDDLSGVTEVFVLGHSLAHVDEPYFSMVLDRVDSKANWSVSYYNDEVAAWSAAESIGIPTARLKLTQIGDL